MRTLKKTLALVLVLAMMLSFAVTANADFTDADEITFGEAVDVLTGLGVIEGMPDGSFDAAGTLTRAQAAKIIVYMLGAEDYAIATEGEFADVAADHWAAGFITFCVDAGIIAGYGDGNFGPSDTLTGYQWAKMLLCALGYNAEAEGMVGSAWQIKVAKLATENGLFAGNTGADKTAAVSREAACLYAFNVLPAECVQYTGGNSVTVGDITFTNGGTLGGTNKSFMATYHPALHSGTLTAENNGGLAADYWWIDGETTPNGAYNSAKDTLIGVYATEEIAASYNSGAKYVQVAKDMGVKNSEKEYTIEFYRNGAYKYSITKTGADILTTYADTLIDNGVTVDVVVTDKGVIRLMANIYYLANITAVEKDDTDKDEDDERSVTIEAANGVTYVLDADCADFEAIFAAAAELDLDNGETIYYIIQPEGDTSSDTAALLYMEEAATVTGKVTATASTYFKVDDVKYVPAFDFSKKSLDGTVDALAANNTATYVFYLDQFGCVKAYDVYDAGTITTDLLVVLGGETKAGSDSLIDGSAEPVAKLQVLNLATGEIEVVDRAVVKSTDGSKYYYAAIDGTASDTEVDKNEVVTLTGDYEVYDSVKLETGYALDNKADTKTVSLKKGVAAVAEGYTATSKTVLTTVTYKVNTAGDVTGATIETVTGIANFPATELKNVDVYLAANTSGVVSEIIYIVKETAEAEDAVYGIYMGLGEATVTTQEYKVSVKGEVLSFVKTSNATIAEGLEVGDIVAYELTGGKVSKIEKAKSVEYGTVALIDETFINVTADDTTAPVYVNKDVVIVDSEAEFAVAAFAAKDKIAYVTAKNATTGVVEIVFAVIGYEAPAAETIAE